MSVGHFSSSYHVVPFKVHFGNLSQDTESEVKQRAESYQNKILNIAKKYPDVLTVQESEGLKKSAETFLKEAKENPERSYMVSLVGRSGSGKTTLAKHWTNSLKDSKSYLSFWNYSKKENTNNVTEPAILMDNYYKDNSSRRKALRKQHGGDEAGDAKFFAETDLDNPNAFQTAEFAEAIEHLKQGKTVLSPEYSYNDSSSTPDRIPITPGRFTLTEGLFPLTKTPDFDLKDKFNLTIFVDAPEDLCEKRSLERWRKTRGPITDEIFAENRKNVKAGYEKFIGPVQEQAMLILRNVASPGKAQKVVSKIAKAMRTYLLSEQERKPKQSFIIFKLGDFFKDLKSA